MPTQTELEFYKAFGIEPDHYETCMLECKPNATLEDFEKSGCDKKDTCPYNRVEDFYPEITDRRLLKLIGLISVTPLLNFIFPKTDIEGIKEKTLQAWIKYKSNFNYDENELFGRVRKIMGVEQ